MNERTRAIRYMEKAKKHPKLAERLGVQVKMKRKQEESALKPCPFCGGEARLESKCVCGGHGFYYNEYFVSCKQCNCKGVAVSEYGKTKEQCIAKAKEEWNARKE